MLIKRSEREARRGNLAAAFAGQSNGGLDRRTFLRRSGLAAGGLAALGSISLATVKKAEAGPPAAPGAKIEVRKNICTHCSVGCTVTAEVANGVWIGQEPSWDSPLNRGSHCAKGAAVRELVHGDRRLKYPVKMENGQWKRISWDQAINEIGDKMLAIREKSGPDSVYWLGSAKSSNEGSYWNRKMAAYWGTNNVDHQARICHSTTVSGVANTWGYGAMTNSYNDIRTAKTVIVMGGNPAEAHPVSLQHLLEGKELQKQNFIVIEPRLTRTAAHANEFVRIRSGTDIPVIWGLLHHIFKNGWEDKEFIRQRVYGMDDVRKEVEKWTPEEVERVTGVPGEQMKRVAEKFAKERPSTLVWCMGATQHTVGTANVRAFCTLLLATGNVGHSTGNGANIFRGHCNVQGATDIGLDIVTLPLYYGLAEGAWRHWSRVWETDYDWFVSRFVDKKIMSTPGIPSTRWFDGTLLPGDQVAQKNPLKAMIIFGHGGNTVTRMPKAAEGIAALELLVVADPHPTTWAVLGDRKNDTYLLPAATQFECAGSRVASNRSLQWHEQIVKPIFEAKDDLEIMYLMAKKLGFAEQMFKNVKVTNNLPLAEDVLREINRGGFSTGYCGQSPERLKAHMRNQHKFDLVTLRAPKDDPEVGGDYYGLPWPCWGTPELKHPGTHRLYNVTDHVMDGGGTFRARFGVQREEKLPDGTTRMVSLLADGSYSKGSELTDGYPEFNYGVFKKLGWDKDLTDAERATIEKIGGANPDAVSWSTDLSGGIQRVCLKVHGVMHYGNAKARANAFGLPDAVPVHREPIYTPRPDLVAKYPTLPDVKAQFRVPNLGFSIQKAAVENGVAKRFPLVCTSGRLVEYEGGGEETRSNKWLAELQQDAFIEISPADASERGITDGQWVMVSGPEMPDGRACRVKALVTERVGKGTTWMPFHFAGWFMNVDQRSKYPQGADPIVLGESVNTINGYGYDPVTGMQEPKAMLCQVRAA
ncbi:MAG TPA: formate dehydrogenase subunit alpha [Xanthobacteraceae bacterium]|nr:formate dehydrogenase subunit alpha [Xanthobacteraceae bacterium]